MKKLTVRLPVAAALAALVVTAASGAAFAKVRDDQPTPIARGAHVSGVAQASSHQPGGSAAVGTATTCSTPGSTNYKTNCHGTGRPVNETWIASNPLGGYVAGANDYNSYNGQGQNGYYTSSDGKTWNDAGPIDVFPHNPNNGGGDPGLAADGNGV